MHIILGQKYQILWVRLAHVCRVSTADTSPAIQNALATDRKGFSVSADHSKLRIPAHGPVLSLCMDVKIGVMCLIKAVLKR